MKLKYRSAVIGFCPDLTDPKASSIPVASLLVGEAVDKRFAAAVVVLPPDQHVALDDLSRLMLGDVPALLRRHLEDVMETLPSDAPLETILYSLHDGLRNSLQVLQVSDEATLDVKDARGLQGLMMDLGVEVLRKALKAIGVELVVSFAPEPIGRSQPVAPTTVHAFPQTSIWPLQHAFG